MESVDDDLFPRTGFAGNKLYEQATNPSLQHFVQIASADPTPISHGLPNYPAIARLAHVSGRISFTAILGAEGRPTGIVATGHPLLRKSAETALSNWLYKEPAGTLVSGGIEFQNNCTSQ